MQKYIYTEKITMIKTIIGNLLLISGIMTLLFVNVKFGPAYIFLWVFMCYVSVFFISTEGIEKDFQSNIYRKFISIYCLNYGLSWKYFHEISYISILETNIKQTIGGRGFRSTATATVSEKKVKINLFDKENRHKTIYIANNKIEAMKIAENIKIYFKVEIKKNFD